MTDWKHRNKLLFAKKFNLVLLFATLSMDIACTIKMSFSGQLMPKNYEKIFKFAKDMLRIP